MDEKKNIFECTLCGFCCHGETTVSLDVNDQKLMVSELGGDRGIVSEKYWRISGSVVQMKTVNGHCIFYNNGCTIYRGRPWRCRQWPLVPALLQGKDNYQTITESCPGFNKEISYKEFCKLLSNYLEKKKKQQNETIPADPETSR